MSEATETLPPTEPPALLVVDDEDAILFSLQDYFEMLGWAVDCARSAVDGCRLLETRRYAAVIVDLRIGPVPNTDGLSVVRRARQQQPVPRTVVLTGYGSTENETLARELGVDAFLSKPLPLRRIASVVGQPFGGER